jgi:hypothetical protein
MGFHFWYKPYTPEMKKRRFDYSIKLMIQYANVGQALLRLAY